MNNITLFNAINTPYSKAQAFEAVADLLDIPVGSDIAPILGYLLGSPHRRIAPKKTIGAAVKAFTATKKVPRKYLGCAWVENGLLFASNGAFAIKTGTALEDGAYSVQGNDLSRNLQIEGKFGSRALASNINGIFSRAESNSHLSETSPLGAMEIQDDAWELKLMEKMSLVAIKPADEGVNVGLQVPLLRKARSVFSPDTPVTFYMPEDLESAWLFVGKASWDSNSNISVIIMPVRLGHGKK